MHIQRSRNTWENTVTRWKKRSGKARSGMNFKRLPTADTVIGSRNRSISMQIWQVKLRLLLMMKVTM